MFLVEVKSYYFPFSLTSSTSLSDLPSDLPSSSTTLQLITSFNIVATAVCVYLNIYIHRKTHTHNLMLVSDFGAEHSALDNQYGLIPGRG